MDDTTPKKCTYCKQPIETLTRRQIIYRGYDNVRRKQVVKQEWMDFCSPKCAAHEQWSREG